MFPADLVPSVKHGLPSRGNIEYQQDGNLAIFVWRHQGGCHYVNSAVCILNSFILSHYSPGISISKVLTYLDFRAQLARELIGEYCSQKRPGCPLSSSVLPPKRISAAHFPRTSTKGHCQQGGQSGFVISAIRGSAIADRRTLTTTCPTIPNLG